MVNPLSRDRRWCDRQPFSLPDRPRTPKIPGTHRDSLYTLDGLVANKTGFKPDTVSTDTAGASEIVLALCWTLGYRYAPRLDDLGDHRLWRIDHDADYGPLDGLARNKINTALIAGDWDEICRLTTSIEAGTVVPSTIMRTLQRGPNPSRLSRALVELGRIIKTLHILNYCHDATYRRDTQRILNRGESRNGLARDVFNGGLGKLAQRYQAGQESQLGALGVLVNAIVLWQTVYTQAALEHLTGRRPPHRPCRHRPPLTTRAPDHQSPRPLPSHQPSTRPTPSDPSAPTPEFRNPRRSSSDQRWGLTPQLRG